MRRVLKLTLLLGAAVGLYQAVALANSSAMPSSPMSSGSAPSMTPLDMAREAYNSGISHKDKAAKFEGDAEKQAAKDRDKMMLKAKDEYGKALKDFKKAADLVPELYQAYNGMGFAYRKTGDYTKALEMYDKALQLAPDFPDAIEYRGEAFLALNRIEDAKKAYLSLFAKDRAQADQLMKAMQTWVAKRQADPAGVDPAAVSSLDSWIKERATIASVTVEMGLSSNQSAWK